MPYYIRDNFYFDIDHLNQLRITGPENHLLMGLTFPRDLEVKINNYYIESSQLIIDISLPVKAIMLAFPLVTDIRTLRSLTEPVTPKPTYEQLISNGVHAILPRSVKTLTIDDTTIFSFSNQYTDSQGTEIQYGSEIIIPNDFKTQFKENYFTIEGESEIHFSIRTISSIVLEKRFGTALFKEQGALPEKYFGSFLRDLYVETQQHIEHLIVNNKTSSFEYGTIFPRDWIESADLGKGDLNQETIDYMYQQSMINVSEQGEGWHEDIVGEYKAKTIDTSLHIDRKMIDIEPHYIMGIRTVSKEFLTKEENHNKLKLIASFILKEAREKQYITFKRSAVTSIDDYFMVGNWRDSYNAFPSQKSPLAPYDVNCVFYPVSLRLLRQYHDYFAITDLEELNELIHRWDAQKNKFRLYHHNNIIGYSLALHGKKNQPLAVAHLDESYDLFYGSPSLEEISSFATKVQDSDYFYTPVGPILVATDEEHLTTKDYHGKVIWPKQAAFTVAGLTKQYFRGQNECWPWPLLQNIRHAIIKTAEACFKGMTDLESVPELYFYDQQQDRARFYTDQNEFEGQMSYIQLWSAVGARRIIHDYISVIEPL